MRALLGFLFLLTFSPDFIAEDEGVARARKVASARALVMEIAARRSDHESEPHDLSDELARQVEGWTDAASADRMREG